MKLFQTYIKRIFRSRINVVFMIVMPAVLIPVIMLLASGQSVVTVGLADYDQTPYTAIMIEELEKSVTIQWVEEGNIRQDLINGAYQYAIVFEQGFTRSLIDGNRPTIQTHRVLESNISMSVQTKLNSLMSAAYMISDASAGNDQAFYQGMQRYQQSEWQVYTKMAGDINPQIPLLIAGLGFLVMSMLFLSVFAANTLIQDKEKRTLYRVLSTPISQKRYMLENIVTFLAVMLMQVTIIMLLMQFVFGFDLSPASRFFRLFVILGVFSITCVALGTAVGSIAKNVKQASVTSTLVVTPICMLGGCFWPREMMPEVLQNISNFVPTSWILDGAEKILRGARLVDVWAEMGILLLFAAFFFLLSSWKKLDVAK